MGSKLRIIATVAMAIFLLTACTKAENKRVAVFYNEYDEDEYSGAVRHGLNEKFKKENLSYESYNAHSNLNKQIEQIKEEIRTGANILLVNMTETTTEEDAEHIVDVAENAHVPVVLFGNNIDEDVIDDYDKAVCIGSDRKDAQKVQGRMIGQYLLTNYDMLDTNSDGKISYVMYSQKEADEDNYCVDKIDSVLALEGKPAVEYYDNTCTQRCYTVTDTHGAYEHMANILKDKTADDELAELVIADNDNLALGVVQALQEKGYNNAEGLNIIPVFGIDATVGAQNAIYNGMMTGSVRQNTEYITRVIDKVCRNMIEGKDKFSGIDDELVAGENKICIPYEEYYGNNNI